VKRVPTTTLKEGKGKRSCGGYSSNISARKNEQFSSGNNSVIDPSKFSPSMQKSTRPVYVSVRMKQQAQRKSPPRALDCSLEQQKEKMNQEMMNKVIPLHNKLITLMQDQ